MIALDYCYDGILLVYIQYSNYHHHHHHHHHHYFYFYFYFYFCFYCRRKVSSWRIIVNYLRLLQSSFSLINKSKLLTKSKLKNLLLEFSGLIFL